MAAFIAAGMTQAASAQDVEIPIRADQMACLVEHQEKYLSLPKSLIIFFVELCPAISGEEVAALALNSGEESTADLHRLIMLKSEFQCLIEKIEAHLVVAEPQPAETPETDEAVTPESDETVTFHLDCT